MTRLNTDTRSWHWPGGSLDQLHIVKSPEGMLLRGEHGPMHYWLFANGAFETQWLRVIHMSGTEAVARLDLERRNGMWWHKDGDVIPGSAEAIDPDLACTAATNTLPIARLQLKIGEIADIQTLYIAVPTLALRIAPQRYYRHRGGYTYENVETGFSARLTVDSDGWVRDYPGVCHLSGS